MYKLKLIRGRSYTGIVKADYKNPFVEVADKAVADALAAKGRFILVGEVAHNTPPLDPPASGINRENPAVIRKMNMSELNAYAAELGIDISGCKNNAERAEFVIAALEKKKNDNSGEAIPLENMTEAQLDIYAAEKGIDLADSNGIAEKLAKIQEILKSESDGVNQVDFDED